MREAENALAWYSGKPVLHRALTPATVDVFKNRLNHVLKVLSPANGIADRERVERALAAALTGYGKGERPTVLAYARLLSDLPVWAVEAACDDVRRGAVVGMNPNYPPPSPMIHKVASEKLEGARAERDKLRLLLKAPFEAPQAEIEPGARDRVETSLQSFHARMATPYDAGQAAKDKAAREEQDLKRANAEEHNRRMEYIMQGFEPPTNRHGITMSMSLARAIGAKLVPRAKPPSPKCEFSPEGEQ